MPPRSKQVDVQEVPTPGRWVEIAPGHYKWEEGTAQELDDRHEPHVVHRHATGWTSEHGTWVFTGVPPLPEGGSEGKAETTDDLNRQIADLIARRDKLQNS